MGACSTAMRASGAQQRLICLAMTLCAWMASVHYPFTLVYAPSLAVDMGFDKDRVGKALRVARGNVAVATDILLQFSS